MLIWLYIVFLIFAATFIYAAWKAAPWMPMYRRDVKRAIDLADIKENDIFFDLGAGDGRTIIAASELGANAKGFEVSLLPYLLAKIKIVFSKSKNKPKIFFRDLWKVNLSEADIVFVFLMPRIMQKLKEKMEKELKPGAKIICYAWPIPGWDIKTVSEAAGGAKIYLYVR
jgi:SAM-dependent methyltransferase